MSDLPADLRGPVPLLLAVPQEALPAPAALAGGAVYEMKWDGFRCAAVHREHGVRLWSRQGRDFSDHFPDMRDAVAAQTKPGTVLDGELVI
jgi:ATP-dependent DNA ligase